MLEKTGVLIFGSFSPTPVHCRRVEKSVKGLYYLKIQLGSVTSCSLHMHLQQKAKFKEPAQSNEFMCKLQAPAQF